MDMDVMEYLDMKDRQFKAGLDKYLTREE